MAGARDGRVAENCVRTTRRRVWRISTRSSEWHCLHELIEAAEQRAEGPEVTEELRNQALRKEHAAKGLQRRRAGESGSQEPNSLAEKLSDRSRQAARQRTGLAQYLHADQEPGGIADCTSMERGCRSRLCVRRSSRLRWQKPFRGWNEGINTSASLSYLLGTSFPPVAFERKQAAGYYSCGFGLRGNDVDCRCGDGAAA